MMNSFIKIGTLAEKLRTVAIVIILLSHFLPSCKSGNERKINEKSISKNNSQVTEDTYLDETDPDKYFKNATKFILAELNKYNWKKVFIIQPEDQLEHEILLVKDFPAIKGYNRLMLVITFTNLSVNTCHGCLGKTSLFEYEKIGKYWQLKKKALAFAVGYEWGLSPDVEILNLGPPRQYGVLVTTGFTSMGYSHEESYLYTFVQGKLREVFMYKRNNSNSESGEPIYGKSYKYETEMQLVKGKGKFFEILLSSEGIFGDQPRDNGKEFVFNGVKYVEKKR
jgi:hypothetical protein